MQIVEAAGNGAGEFLLRGFLQRQRPSAPLFAFLLQLAMRCRWSVCSAQL
jgi:hypothetical protein